MVVRQMKKPVSQADFENRLEALNDTGCSLCHNEFQIGWEAIARLIADALPRRKARGRASRRVIILDGYEGTDWASFIARLRAEFSRRGLSADLRNAAVCLKPKNILDKQLRPFLGDDPVFGRIYKKGLRSLFDGKKLAGLRSALGERIIVFYGTGAALIWPRQRADLLLYADITRQEALRRQKRWSNLAGKTQSISPKKLYYVDFQANDQHRNRLLSKIDFYVDGNRLERPALISGPALKRICAALASRPFRLKPIYEPGPWGGQWLKKIRKLPADWINCAWSYEVIAQEMSLNLRAGAALLELPWTTFFHLEYKRIMGSVPKRKFGGEFPIRYDYLDTMKGGDLSIQVHPTTPYIRRRFNEPYHQGEMYYIMESLPGSRVNIGLNADVKRERFYRAAKLADERAVPFDYREHVNSVPSKKHDLLQIPPGTVHGSGEGQVVLEISATTYRYTFKIYDHLRPDLSGVMRPIHLAHAFNVIKWFRRGDWVSKNLIQEPRLVRSGAGWAEYLLADRREFFHLVFRLEFARAMNDDTAGRFHIHTLVEGDKMLLQSLANPAKCLTLRYSETAVVPACFGKYRLINLGGGPCKTAKARLR